MNAIVNQRTGCVLVLLASCAFAASGQVYPTKPVRVLIEVPAGSVADVAIRQAGQEMGARFGQPLVLENRAGANGIISTEACSKAPPDGYTLCVVAPSFVWNNHASSKLPYDTDRDFKPVARLFFLIEAILGSSKLPVNTLKELQTLAAANPGKFNVGTLGPGSQPDVFRQWLADRWNTSFLGIPYKGGAPVLAALMSGEIDFAQIGVGNAASLFQSGKVKVLAVGSAQRLKALPKVPTLKEAGLGDAPGGIFWGIVAPAGVPDAIVNRLNSELRRQFTEPKFVEFLDSRYLEPAFTTPEEFRAYLQAQRESTGMLVKKFNIQFK